MRIILATMVALGALAISGTLAAPGDATAVPTLTVEDSLLETVSERYGHTLALLRTEFPGDYASLMAGIASIRWQEVDPDISLLAAFSQLGDLREKYADKLLFAPSLNHSIMLGRLADFYDAVLKDEGAEVCGRFAADGSAVLFELGLSEKYARALDLQSLAYFEAVVQAIETPTYAGIADGSDWGTVLGIMVRAGAPPSFVETISAGDPKDPDLCPALAAMFRATGLLDSPEGMRTRADFAKNLAGY